MNLEQGTQESFSKSGTGGSFAPPVLREEAKSLEASISIEDMYANTYDPPIPRKLLEGLTNLSTNTIVKLEAEGVISPIKARHGDREVLVYRASDVRAIFNRRGISFKPRGKTEVIAVFSQKGGVGKSTFTQHLASMLSLVGRVLVVDLDSQSDITSLFGLNSKSADLINPEAELEPTIAELMDWTQEDGSRLEYRKMAFDDVVKKISDTLHVIPADLDLTEINYSLNRSNLKNGVNEDGSVRPTILYMIKDVIDSVKDRYDYILFDCPPNVETCNVNALFAANRIIIPLELEAKCLKTMRRNEDFLKRLQGLHEGFNWDKILVVANKYKKETIKLKALARLEDIYQDRTDVSLSQAVFPSGAIIDRCSESREPVFVTASKFGKEYKSGIVQGKNFTNLFWIVMHEILGLNASWLVFDDPEQMEAK